MKKTVYILGAGFSIPAGGPTQAQIMENIWNISSPDFAVERRNSLKHFLQTVLNVDEQKVQLEDIYTPIDRCLADGVALRGQNLVQMTKHREDLGYLISLAIKKCFDSRPSVDSEYAQTFAAFLVNKASVRATKALTTDSAQKAKDHDPFAIISLNWDVLLDNALNKELRKRHPIIKGDYDPFGVVDYCCYISSIQAHDQRVRSGLWTLGCRGYNVKLLKLHGSMNWLQCPNCQRLFVGFDDKHVIPNYESPQKCRHCKKHDNDAHWRGAMVMPTFIKDLSNFQIKLIWQNAGVELMEARKLVFIGYSLPSADFEFRQLLSRMVHKDAEIEVYLSNKAKSFDDEKWRYESFFSRHNPRIFGGGVEAFISTL